DHIVEQNTLPFIIADLSLGAGHRDFVAPGVRPERTIQEIELAVHLLGQRFQAARAIRLQAGRQPALNPYILDDLVLAVMLFDQIGASAAFDRSDLAVIRPEIDGPGLKLLRKLDRM